MKNRCGSSCRAWTEETFSYEGTYHQIPPVWVSPKPVQKPHPPVYVVAVSPQTVAFAGRSGHCVFLPATRSIAELRDTSRWYWQNRHDGGFDGSPARCRSTASFTSPTMMTPHASRSKRRSWPSSTSTPDLKAALSDRYCGVLNYDRFVEDFCIVGSPDTVASRLRELQMHVGTSYVLCSLNFVTLEHELCLRSMRLLANEVMPQLHEIAAAVEVLP